MPMPRSPHEVIADICAEASQDSCGQPKDPADYRSSFDTWHNNAQREHLYDLAMELAAAMRVEQAMADYDADAR